MIGQTLAGRYRITREIARGGMGVVFAAEQLGLGRHVAIKALDVNMADPSWVARFETEAQILANLRHPNTLSVFDYGRMEDGTPYLVTELLQGEALSNRVKAGALPEDETLLIMHDVAAALAEAHSLGIVHRDLKPGNIVVDDVQGVPVVKVLDFGLAKRIEQDKLTTQEMSGVRTQAGTLLGTPAYISPEQAKGEPVTAQSDLYALGATAFHLLTGKFPFEGDPLEQVLLHGTEEMPSFASKNGPPVRPEVEALVARLMAKKPTERPASAQEVMQSIADLRKPVEMTTTRTVVSKPLLVATAIALITSGIVLAVLMLEQRPTNILAEPDPQEVVVDASAPPEKAVETEFESNGRVVRIEAQENWLQPDAVSAVIAQLVPVLTTCHKDSEAGAIQVRFEIDARGRAVIVDPPQDRFRYCLVSKLPQAVDWPVRTKDAFVVVSIQKR